MDLSVIRGSKDSKGNGDGRSFATLELAYLARRKRNGKTRPRHCDVGGVGGRKVRTC